MAIETIHKLDPAYSVVERLGGKSEVAELLDVDKSTITRWCQPKPGGTGGVIPLRYWRPLLEQAKDRGIDLRLEELSGVEA
jgi:hypothetical protein